MQSFTRTFGAVTSTDFNVYAYGQPNEVYNGVARELTNNGYSGILLVCDEFTEFLRRFEHAIEQQNREVDSETLAVQNVAESSERSGAAQLHFIVASLQPFASSSAGSSSGQASKAIERLGGRFRSYALTTQASEELLRGALQKTAQGKALTLIPNRQKDELLEIAKQLYQPQGKKREWIREVVVEGAFPLHPLTTFALPLLNQQVAQSQRTMFLFLNDAQGLKGFLGKATLNSDYPHWTTLLTLDYLYDYFAESIAVRRSEVSDAYDHARHLMGSATVDTSLAQRVLKILALSEVIAPHIPTTRTGLRHALNLPPDAESTLTTALSILEQFDAIVPPNDENGTYSIAMVGRTNASALRRRIAAQAQGMTATVQRLHNEHPPEAVEADSYNKRVGTQRQLTAFYVGLAELTNPVRLIQELKSHDAVLWYVVASSETERDEALAHARTLTQREPRLVVAVPMKPLDVLTRLRDYDALTIVRKDPKVEGGAHEYLQDKGRIGRDYREALDKALAAMKEPRQWEWFRKGFPQASVNGQSQVQELASSLMKDVFSATPEQHLAQHFKPTGISASLKKAASAMLGGEVRIPKTGNAPEFVILRKGAVDLGVMRLDKLDGSVEVFQLAEPDSKYNSKQVWNRMHEQLGAGKWKGIVDELRKPPYGLYDSHLVIFLAALLTKHADEIEIRSATGVTPRPLPLDVELLEKLVTQPRDYTITLQPLQEAERQWLRGLVTQATRKPFDQTGGRGTTLRDRVAEQLRGWLKGLRLPVFAEKLDAAQLEKVLPDAPSDIRAVIAVLTGAIRSDGALAAALFDDLPAALQAPADRKRWTAEIVDALLATYAMACRTLEQLPAVLERYATQRIAGVFGAEQENPAEMWETIYRWRNNRTVVPTADLPAYPRQLMIQTNKPNGSIKEGLLQEFAQGIVGINNPYQQWSSLDVLDRLEQEVRKAFDEIESRWKARIPKEEVWRSGIAHAVHGRPSSTISKEFIGRALVEWCAAITWPACTTTLHADEVQHLYPTLSAETCADMVQILRRTSYTTVDWQQELIDELPRQFGVQDWLAKAEVDGAVKRFATALQNAQTLEAVLRQHVLAHLAAVFGAPSTVTPLADVITSWLEAHPIPTPNDLPEAAALLLQHLRDSSVAETTLLTTLPRALPAIGQPLPQWTSYAVLERYLTTVEQAVGEINRYVPLTKPEYHWLTAVIEQGIRQPLTTDAYEQGRLAHEVYTQIRTWLAQLTLPPFSATLSVPDLHTLLPTLDTASIQTMHLLLQQQGVAQPSVIWLLTTLPSALGSATPSSLWSDVDVDKLLAGLSTVCRQLSDLKDVLVRAVYSDIGTAFGIEVQGVDGGVLAAKLRDWREAHVIFKDEQLSDDAEFVFDALSSANDDPAEVLLNKLPKRLGEVRAPYSSWQQWDDRQSYFAALKNAAQEIEHIGHIGDATARVHNLWATLKQQMDELAADERRWLIKAFDETYRV